MKNILPFEVHWRVPVGCGFSGFFTEVVLGYLPALWSLGVPVRLLSGRCDDRWLSSHLDAGDAAVVRDAWIDEHALTEAQSKAALAIEHGEPCGMRSWQRARPWRVIARAMSEGDLSPSNAQCLSRADEVWVPTQWHVDRFVAAGVRASSLVVMPEAVDVHFFSPDQPDAVRVRAARGPDSPFTFVSVFKWEHRKGWDLLLDAYWREFANEATSGRVTLRLKTYLPSWEPGPRDLNEHLEMHARGRRHRARRDELPKVELLVEDASRAGMRTMYAAADAFVLPTRGEGWGLPICEAMAMGLPAIATNFSGPTAFLTSANSHPLPVASALPGGFAETSIRALRQAMRAAYEERGTPAGTARSHAARADMVQHFSREVVGRLLLARLQAIGATAPVEEAQGGGKRGARRSGRDRKEELRRE